MDKDTSLKIQEALSQFIINATERNAPGHAVQALPEAVKVLIELHKLTNSLR